MKEDNFRRLSPASVSALDSIRALAAIYVVIHHVAIQRDWLHGFGMVLKFGQEAVLVFFMLSGAVIFLSERNRVADLQGYALRRILRIYPTLIFAILVSTLVAFDNGDFHQNFGAASLFGTLLGLQDISFLKPGVIVDPYMQNAPLWSLSYEMFFYAAFPVAINLWRKHPRASENIIGLICCASYICYAAIPNHWTLVIAYFQVWWLGAMAMKCYLDDDLTFIGMQRVIAWSLGLLAVSGVALIHAGYAGAYQYPALPFRHFFVAVAGVALIISVYRHTPALSPNFADVFKYLASISYGIYVLHFPLLVQSVRAKTTSGLILMAGVMFVIAYISDRMLHALISNRSRTVKSYHSYLSSDASNLANDAR